MEFRIWRESLDPGIWGVWSLVPVKCGGKTPQLVSKPLRKGHSLTGTVVSGILKRIQLREQFSRSIELGLRPPGRACWPAGPQISERTHDAASGNMGKSNHWQLEPTGNQLLLMEWRTVTRVRLIGTGSKTKGTQPLSPSSFWFLCCTLFGQTL